MRRKKIKDRCQKQSLSKCQGVCKTYDAIQTAYAKMLQERDSIIEFRCILNLKNNGQVINMNICSVGTLNASLVNGREVFKSAILSNASAIICFHVHPSGNPEPSEEDKTVTEKLAQAGKFLDIPRVDHCIIAGGTGEMFSFKANGLMDEIQNNTRSTLCER